jgi:predicted dehydrogenase
MTQPVRWGILGASGFARAEMAPAIHLAEGGLLAALATRDPARAAPFVACYPGLRIHESYDALLADPDIDAVYVPLPNDMHAPWTLRAAAAGKHVLCEKPIALRADDIDRLIAARDASGKLIAEGFMVVHHPQWARVRAMLADGAVGDLRRVDGAFTFYNDDRGNIRNIAERGGGALYDIGVYPTVTTRFATTSNFRVIKRYNNSDAYAIGVGHLADRIGGAGPLRGSFPPDANGLTKADRIALQERLTARGFDTQGADGVIGPNTEAAIRAYQASQGMAVTGTPSQALLQSLR